MFYHPKQSLKSTKNKIQSQMSINKPYSQNIKIPSKTITSNKKIVNSFNNQILYQCRQNRLNAGYNKRVNNLKIITAQNKKIYQRINSQKTIYSNTELNKSYQSSNSISKRLSQSKLSKRQNTPKLSRIESRQKIRNKKVLDGKDNTYYIQSQNINNMKNNDIKKFSELFYKHQSTTSNHVKTRKDKDRRNSFTVSKQTLTELPKINQKNTITLPYRSQKKDDCSILHRIAEQMFDNPRTRKTLMI